MNKTYVALSVLAASVGGTSLSLAQERNDRNDLRTGDARYAGAERDDRRRGDARFGDAGQFAISAERMSGVGFAWDRTEINDTTDTTRSFNLSILSNPLANLATTYTFPRVGLDFFIADGLSIGAALGFAYATFNVDDEEDFVNENDRLTSFLAAPRIGYAFMFTDHIGVWPRVGVSWLWTNLRGADDTELSRNRFALTVEAPFVISPTDNAAILLGPTLDLGLAGSNTLEGFNGELDTDVRTTELGIQAGLLVFF